jgi:CheY-like chemotaxis protein
VIATAELLNGMREVLTHTLGAEIVVRVLAVGGVPPVLADRSQLELAERLEDFGFKTIMASSGSEAVALIESGVALDACPAA